MIIEQIFSLCGDSVQDKKMLELLFIAHATAAETNVPVSSGAVINSAIASGDFDKAVISAICMTGDVHAPVRAARNVIFRGYSAVGKIPGFGNSFYKDEIDPAFVPLDIYLSNYYPEVRIKITEANSKCSGLYPNAAAYTAAVAEIINLPEGLEQLLFILPRLCVWAKQYKDNVKR